MTIKIPIQAMVAVLNAKLKEVFIVKEDPTLQRTPVTKSAVTDTICR